MKNLFLQTKLSYLEKLRRFSFIAMAAACLFASFVLVPDGDATRMQVLLVEPDFFKQATNPTWIPMASALCLGLMLPLFGFSYLKNTLTADRESGLLSLYQSSGCSPLPYLLGKFFSGCLVLFSFVVIVATGSALVSLFRFPGQFLSPITLLTPFIALLPGLVFTVAAALLFEALPFFRNPKGGTWATVLFFSLFMFTLVNSAMVYTPNTFSIFKILDISGYNTLFTIINSAAFSSGFHRPIEQMLILGSTGENTPHKGLLELTFSPVALSPEAILQIILLLLLSFGIVVLASFLLEKRPLLEHFAKSARSKKAKQTNPTTIYPPLQQIPVPPVRFSFASLYLAESKRLFLTLSRGWLFFGAGLWLLTWFLPFTASLFFMPALLYAWALPFFSALGSAEKSTGMEELYRSISNAPVRQTLASWASSAVFSLLLSFPLAFQYSKQGLWAGVLMAAMWALVLPTVALTFGSVSKSPRGFQIICIIFLYIVLNIPELFFPLSPTPLFINSLVYASLFALCFLFLLLQRKKTQL